MLTAYIVDDEHPARRRLRSLLAPLEEADRLRVLNEAEDGVELLDLFHDEPADVLFLDIQMPELDGFDVLERIPLEQRPEIIFTTAYDEHALRAFETSAVDYLLKPISQEDLERAVRRVEHICRQPALHSVSQQRLNDLLEWIEGQDAPGGAPGSASGAEASSFPHQLTVSHGDRIRVIRIDEVVSIEIHEGITRFYTLEADASGRQALHQHPADYTLDHLEETLDPAAFMRIHRSALVQLRYVRELIPWFSGRYKLILVHDHEVVASRERSRQLKDRLSI